MMSTSVGKKQMSGVQRGREIYRRLSEEIRAQARAKSLIGGPQRVSSPAVRIHQEVPPQRSVSVDAKSSLIHNRTQNTWADNGPVYIATPVRSTEVNRKLSQQVKATSNTTQMQSTSNSDRLRRDQQYQALCQPSASNPSIQSAVVGPYQSPQSSSTRREHLPSANEDSAESSETTIDVSTVRELTSVAGLHRNVAGMDSSDEASKKDKAIGFLQNMANAFLKTSDLLVNMDSVDTTLPAGNELADINNSTDLVEFLASQKTSAGFDLLATDAESTGQDGEEVVSFNNDSGAATIIPGTVAEETSVDQVKPNISSQFTSKCSVDRSTVIQDTTGQKKRCVSQLEVTLKSQPKMLSSAQQDITISHSSHASPVSSELMLPVWCNKRSGGEEHFKRPHPAHTNQHVTTTSRNMRTTPDQCPIDLTFNARRISPYPLQVDGLNDSKDSNSSKVNKTQDEETLSDSNVGFNDNNLSPTQPQTPSVVVSSASHLISQSEDKNVQESQEHAMEEESQFPSQYSQQMNTKDIDYSPTQPNSASIVISTGSSSSCLVVEPDKISCAGDTTVDYCEDGTQRESSQQVSIVSALLQLAADYNRNKAGHEESNGSEMVGSGDKRLGMPSQDDKKSPLWDEESNGSSALFSPTTLKKIDPGTEYQPERWWCLDSTDSDILVPMPLSSSSPPPPHSISRSNGESQVTEGPSSSGFNKKATLSDDNKENRNPNRDISCNTTPMKRQDSHTPVTSQGVVDDVLSTAISDRYVAAVPNREEYVQPLRLIRSGRQYSVFKTGINDTSTPSSSQSSTADNELERGQKRSFTETLSSGDEESSYDENKAVKKVKPISKNTKSTGSNQISPADDEDNEMSSMSKRREHSDVESVQPRKRCIGYRRAAVSEEAKARVRAIAMKRCPELYNDTNKEKDQKEVKKREAAKKAYIKKNMPGKHSDDDTSQKATVTKSPVVGRVVFRESQDSYEFTEESDEEDHRRLHEKYGNQPRYERSAESERRSIRFNNPQLSRQLGRVNNPFNASGWIKTRCGDSSTPDDHLPDLVTENNNKQPPKPLPSPQVKSNAPGKKAPVISKPDIKWGSACEADNEDIEVIEVSIPSTRCETGQ